MVRPFSFFLPGDRYVLQYNKSVIGDKMEGLARYLDMQEQSGTTRATWPPPPLRPLHSHKGGGPPPLPSCP